MPASRPSKPHVPRPLVAAGLAVLLGAWLAWVDDAPVWPAARQAAVAALPRLASDAAAATAPARPAAVARDLEAYQPAVAMWTIDDCPDGDGHAVRFPKERQVADFIAVFKRHHLAPGQVVFFMTGSCYARYPDLVAAIHEAGYLIGNHTYSHANLTLAPDPAAEIDRGPHETRYFRPPYGQHNARIDALIARRGLVLLQWDVTAADSGTGGLENSCDVILHSLERLHPLPGRMPVVDLHMYNPLSPVAVDAYLSGRTSCDGAVPRSERRATA